MGYKYRNDKHVILHGMKPGEIKEFDEKIEGGGITLMNPSSEDTEEKSRKVKSVKTIKGGGD